MSSIGQRPCVLVSILFFFLYAHVVILSEKKPIQLLPYSYQLLTEAPLFRVGWRVLKVQYPMETGRGDDDDDDRPGPVTSVFTPAQLALLSGWVYSGPANSQRLAFCTLDWLKAFCTLDWLKAFCTLDWLKVFCCHGDVGSDWLAGIPETHVL